MQSLKTPRILIIGGSDSGGGAGIQADIKTVTMLGGHAMTAITAITAQNTINVTGIHLIPASVVLEQIDVVVDDIGVDAIKIGMIGSAEIAEVVATRLENMAGTPIIFDPVMVATSGAMLADRRTIKAFDRLMQVATITTPNSLELSALGGEKIARERGLILLAKGGHLGGSQIVDRLIGPNGEIARWAGSRIATRHTHGTGCTLASAIATGLAKDMGMIQAIKQAREFVRHSLHAAPGFGAGDGPMGQQHVRLWPHA